MLLENVRYGLSCILRLCTQCPLAHMLTFDFLKRGKQGGRNRGRYNRDRDGARKVGQH